MCAFLQPLPDIGSRLCQAVLHVDLLLALAGPGQVRAGEQTALAVLQPFGLVEKVVGETLVTEDEPVPACITLRLALLHEGAEGGDAGTSADHDDRCVAIGWQSEVRVGLDKDTHPIAFFQQVAQVAGSGAGVMLAVVTELHDTDSEVHFIAHVVL